MSSTDKPISQEAAQAMLAALREAYLSLECREGTAHVTALVAAAIALATEG